MGAQAAWLPAPHWCLAAGRYRRHHRVSLTPAPGGDRTKKCGSRNRFCSRLEFAASPRRLPPVRVAGAPPALSSRKWQSRSESYLREQMPVWKGLHRRRNESRRHGMRGQWPWRIQTCQSWHLSSWNFRRAERRSTWMDVVHYAERQQDSRRVHPDSRRLRGVPLRRERRSLELKNNVGAGVPVLSLTLTETNPPLSRRQRSDRQTSSTRDSFVTRLP